MTHNYLWPSPDAVLRLNKMLNLPASGKEQDWQIELADEDRVEEWLVLFRDGRLDFDDRSALALLILHSLPIIPDDDPNDPLPEIGAKDAQELDDMRAALLNDSPVRARMLSYFTHFGWLKDSPALRMLLATADPA